MFGESSKSGIVHVLKSQRAQLRIARGVVKGINRYAVRISFDVGVGAC